MTYEPEDAAYDAYVADHGDPYVDMELPQFPHVAEVRMHPVADGGESLELRLYTTPRMIVEAWPARGERTPRVVREIPYGPRTDGSELLDNMVSGFTKNGWTLGYSWRVTA